MFQVKWVRTVLVLLILLTIWQIAVNLSNIPPYVLPDPISILKAGFQHYPLIIKETGFTVIEILLGLIFGALFGITAALIVDFFRPLRYWLLPILLITQVLPIFAIAPLLVIWLGYGLTSKIVTILLMLFFPITSSFLDGLRRTPIQYLEMANIMNAKRVQLFWHIKIPAALPNLASGLRIACIFAPMGALISEWVGAKHGLGLLMIKADLKMQIDLMFCCLFVIASIGLLLYFSINKLLKRWITW